MLNFLGSLSKPFRTRKPRGYSFAVYKHPKQTNNIPTIKHDTLNSLTGGSTRIKKNKEKTKNNCDKSVPHSSNK